jgi:hypothetical protein
MNGLGEKVHATSINASVDRPRGGLLWRALGREIVLMGILIGGYEWGRKLVSGQAKQANANALRVWQWQHALHLPTEAAVQQWAMAWHSLARMANVYYVGAHFPVTVAVLVWLFVRHHRAYLLVRTQLALATAAALAIIMYFPLTPPRLMPQFGMTDTMVTIGPSAYPAGPPTASAYVNQFAAMPSLHVGWALLMAIAIIMVAKSNWRWLALLHPAATWFVVVVTANHYWLDGFVGCMLIVGSIALTTVIARRTASSRPVWAPLVGPHGNPTAGGPPVAAVIPAATRPGEFEADVNPEPPLVVRRN